MGPAEGANAPIEPACLRVWGAIRPPPPTGCVTRQTPMGRRLNYWSEIKYAMQRQVGNYILSPLFFYNINLKMS